jgi:hypothetical protein
MLREINTNQTVHLRLYHFDRGTVIGKKKKQEESVPISVHDIISARGNLRREEAEGQ